MRVARKAEPFLAARTSFDLGIDIPQFIVAAGFAQWPEGRTEQLSPRCSDVTTGGVAAGRANAVTVRIARVPVGRVVGATLDGLGVDCCRLGIEVEKRGYVIAASGPQVRFFRAKCERAIAVDVARDGLLLRARIAGRGGY